MVAAPAAAIRAQIGRWSTIEEQTDGSCKIQIHAESLDWAAFALAVINAEFRLHGPPELIEHLVSWKDRFTRATAQRNGSRAV